MRAKRPVSLDFLYSCWHKANKAVFVKGTVYLTIFYINCLRNEKVSSFYARVNNRTFPSYIDVYLSLKMLNYINKSTNSVTYKNHN